MVMDVCICVCMWLCAFFTLCMGALIYECGNTSPLKHPLSAGLAFAMSAPLHMGAGLTSDLHELCKQNMHMNTCTQIT